MAAGLNLGTKIFFKIGEVSKITQLPAYVLRFWESQFSFLKPKKSRGQQRLYVRHDVETILEIKRMLYDEGYTLEGVRRFWGRRGRQGMRSIAPRDMARRMRSDLHAILRILDTYEK